MTRRLVLAHGFTQTGGSWGRFAELLARERTLVPVDLPGHGDASELRATLEEAGSLLADVCAAEPSDLLGYSLGARVAMHAVLARPSAVGRLVLIGATAGIEDDAQRVARRERDESLAHEAERDVEGFLQRWVAAPMFSGVADPGLDERRRNTGAGLASSLRLAGTGTQTPLWDQLSQIESPTLLLAGADDVRFALTARRMSRCMPHAYFSLVPGAGHAAHLEQPELTARLVSRFLS